MQLDRSGSSCGSITSLGTDSEYRRWAEFRQFRCRAPLAAAGLFAEGMYNSFQPHRWNQRYCQDPHCRRELRRWQNAQRQQRRRQQAEVRRQHAERERTRRQAKRQAARLALVAPADWSAPPAQLGAREGGAWSRGKKNSAPFCHRPGCYEPLPNGGRAPCRYCGHECGQAMRRVQERERKRLRRQSLVIARTRGGARTPPAKQPGAAAASGPVSSTTHATAAVVGPRSRVRISRPDEKRGLSSRLAPHRSAAETPHSPDPHEVEEAQHDRETTARPRPRPPPAP